MSKNTFPPCEEMQKLREALTNFGVQWTDESNPDICTTWFKVGQKFWSVINGRGTLGGFPEMSDPSKNFGLLELWDQRHAKGHEPKGYLTANDVIARVGM